MNTKRVIRNVFLTVLIFASAHVWGQTRLAVLGWNVESGGNNPFYISHQLSVLHGYDIVGLCEVREDFAPIYAEALAYGEGYGRIDPEFRYALGSTGRSDRLMIVWDARRLQLVAGPFEIDSLNDGRHRSPLYAQFRLLNTQESFIFMVNHLARGSEEMRQLQAAGLANWAARQTLPIFAVGDYNFDYNLDINQGNAAMTLFLQNGAFKWVRPAELTVTNAALNYNSILDFLFIAHKPRHWQVFSKILTEQFVFPDSDESSDHRPIQGIILIKEP